MGNALHIALRYLFAKKSHNVINIISIICAAGIAIGSMALVLILSVYNGFDNSIKEIYEGYKADYVIEPIHGKTFTLTPHTLEELGQIPGISNVNPVVEEKVFLKYDGREAIAILRGTNDKFLQGSYITGNIIEGEPAYMKGEISQAVISQTLAYTLGLRVRFLAPLELYFPRKDARVSITNPLESINTATLYPSAIIRTDAENAENLLYADASTVRELAGIPAEECSMLEINLSRNILPDNLKKMQSLFPDCTIKDKAQQNATLYKMMKAEKFAVYLILFFVIAIISVNIFSCLSMLITDKREDIETFLSMGATRELAEKIFHLHGFLISLLGCLIGTGVGLAAAYLQKTLGIITVPGNYLISAYPVDIRAMDILIIFAGVSAIGYAISWLPVKKFFKK